MECSCALEMELRCKRCTSKPLEWRVYELIQRLNHVSFAELEKLSGFGGAHAIQLEDKNIVLWMNCSMEAVAVIDKLLRENKISMKKAPPIVYKMDGCRVPTLPLATRLYNYKKPRWLPVTFTALAGESPA